MSLPRSALETPNHKIFKLGGIDESKQVFECDFHLKLEWAIPISKDLYKKINSAHNAHEKGKPYYENTQLQLDSSDLEKLESQLYPGEGKKISKQKLNRKDALFECIDKGTKKEDKENYFETLKWKIPELDYSNDDELREKFLLFKSR